MKIVDLQLNIDGLRLSNSRSVEDIIKDVEKIIDSAYPIKYDVLYEEEM